MLNNNKGFISIELISVIFIISILAVLTISSINTVFKNVDILNNMVDKRDVYISSILKDEDPEGSYNDFYDYYSNNIDTLIDSSKNVINNYEDLLNNLTDEDFELIKRELNDDDFDPDDLKRLLSIIYNLD